MKKVADIKCRWFAGEKTALISKEGQEGKLSFWKRLFSFKWLNTDTKKNEVIKKTTFEPHNKTSLGVDRYSRVPQPLHRLLARK